MHTVLKIVFLLILCFALTVFIGCAKKKVVFFHGDMPNFEPGPKGGVDLVDIKKGVDFSLYKMILVDPLYMHFDSTDQYTAISSRELRDLRADFNRAIVDALGEGYLLVDTPRPDALRLRVQITGMVPSIPDTSANDRQWKYLSVGGASIKAELVDSLTNERVAAAMDTKTGDNADAVKSMDKWVHSKKAFRFWAKRLRIWLDKMHGK